MGAMPGMPGAAADMAAGMPGMGQNPMMAMLQMMQMMMGQSGMVPQIDPAAVPFAGANAKPDNDLGLDADIIRPSRIVDRIRTQESVPTGSVLDYLCLTEDGQNALGGLSKGCMIAFAGPPGKGKTPN